MNARRNRGVLRRLAGGAAVLMAIGSLSACGRTGLNVEETLGPAEPNGSCGGWPGEFFLTYARGNDSDTELTALALYPSKGDGTFGAPVMINMKEAFTGVMVDDFDDDGFLEIHLWLLSTGVEYILDYSCAEGWYMKPLFGGAAPPRHELSSFGDVNNDGYVDAVGWVPAKDKNNQPHADAFDVFTSLGGAGGTYTHKYSALNLANKVVWWLASTRHIRDMDGDGCADLIFIKYDHGGNAKSGVYLAQGDCTGQFGEPKRILTMPFPGTGDDIGDLDGDGHMDLIAGLDDDGDPGQTWVAKGNGFGALDAPIPVFDVVGAESGHDGAGFGSIFLYDWDHDGRLDALSGYTTGSNFSKPRIDIRKNLGDFTFDAPSIVVPAPLAYEQWFVGPASK